MKGNERKSKKRMKRREKNEEKEKDHKRMRMKEEIHFLPLSIFISS